MGKDRAMGRRLRTLFDVGAIGDLTDGQLLERFATDRGEGAELAFAALVERHGPMVLRACRAALDDAHDSDDAFQATFLVLVAKARGLWVRDSLGPWLHQVARRTASSARAGVLRRRRLERRAAVVELVEEPRADRVDDLARVIHEEIDRLPERYRAPVVLCDLEGRTHEQAARALGWPIGTVKSRQARARERLRDRLTRRGLAPGLGLIAIGRGVDASALPATLVDKTTVAAVRFVGSRAIVPGTVAALAREVIRTMTILRWTKAASALLAVGVAASGAGLVAQDQGDKPGGGPSPPNPAGQARDVPADASVVEVKLGRGLMLSERGNLEASKVHDVLCEIEGGTVILSLMPEGAMVKQGDVVAELDAGALRDRLVNQRIATQRAEGSFKQALLVREVSEYAVKEYSEGIFAQDRSTLKGKVALAQEGIEKGRARLERTRLALKRMDKAIANRVGPETLADIAADLTINDHIEVAELDVRGRELDLEQAKGQQDVLERFTFTKMTKQLLYDVQKNQADEQTRHSSWDLEQTKERKLERQIKRCTLRAPGNGLLVLANEPGRPVAQARPQIEAGATVRERQKIFSVIDLADPLRVNAKVHESYVERVRPGQKVRIKVDAAAYEVLSGVVQSVAPMADANRVFVDGRKVYTTRISIEGDNAKLNLRPGMSASVEILYGSDDVPLVPTSCLFESAPETYHLIVKGPGGAFEWRDVTLGMSDSQVIEIKAGLKPGEFVVVNPSTVKGLDMKGKKALATERRNTPG